MCPIMIKSDQLLFLVIITCWTGMATATGQSAANIRGSAIPCHKEGQEVFIDGISQDPCISCTCQNLEVKCARESCPDAPSCYFLLFGKKRSCCDSCKGCQWKGEYHSNGDVWSDTNDPCTVHACQSGVLTSTKVQCHATCRNPVPPGPGQCCPSCPSLEPCSDNPGEVLDSRKPKPKMDTGSSDPCVQCLCEKNGQSRCWKQACPVLPCPPSRYAYKTGECCPVCRGVRKGYEVPGKCDLGLQMMNHGQKIVYDLCTECSCNGSTAICKRSSCPSLECPAELQVHHPEVCCPRCRGQEEQQQKCQFRGKIYQNGDSWKLDKCSRCNCNRQVVECEFQDCSKQAPCPPRFQLKPVLGECCPKCVEEDSVCSVFGEPHYKTFDGHIYNFHVSSCRYTLTRDCSSSSSFAINIVNDAKNKGGSGLRSAILKVADIKVQLSSRLRVKVGRDRVRLPYIKLEVLSITMENQTILVRTNIGVKVLWDGENYLEVSAPSNFKGKLCGLCGNYNGNPNDDLKTKKGQIVTDPFEFGQSWQSGKKFECKQKNPSSSSIRMAGMECGTTRDSRIKARRDCSIFKQSLLATCQSAVNPAPFFHSCMKDVCKCRQSKKCHCQTIKAYSRECERSGVLMTSWRNATSCEGSHCPLGSVFTVCGASCRKTCKNHQQNRGPNCRRKCQPGCECTSGKVWHRHKCILPQNCPALLS